MDATDIAKANPGVDVRWLADLESLNRNLRELGAPMESGYHLSPPLGRMPWRGLQPPKPSCKPLRLRPFVRR